MKFWSIFFSFVLAGWVGAGSYIYTCQYHQLCCTDCEQDTSETTQDESSDDVLPSATDTTSPDASESEEKLPTAENLSPEEIKEKLEKQYTVYFELASTEPIFDPNTQEFLQLAEEYIQQNTKAKILVEGHTDTIGTPERNLVLGEKRAQNIKGSLVQMGIPSDKIIIESKGQSQPLEKNDTEAGRKKNRRVLIQLQNN